MTKYFVTVLLLLLSQLSNSQSIKGIVTKKTRSLLPKDTVEVIGLNRNSPRGGCYLVKIDKETGREVPGQNIYINPKDCDFWNYNWVLNRGFQVHRKGWNYDLRRDLDNEYKDYMKEMDSKNLIYSDHFLEDYLSQLLHKVCPNQLIKGRPGGLNIKIIKSANPEAFSFDNGTIVLTTGLIANSTCEDELVAAMTREVAHIILDHNLVNLENKIKSERNAVIFGALAEITSAVILNYSNYKHGTNFSGFEPRLIGIGGYLISKSLLDAIGASYSKEQDFQADSLAWFYVPNIGYKQEAVISLLIKSSNYNQRTNSQKKDVAWRLNRFRERQMKDTIDLKFIRKIGNVITQQAWMEYQDKHYDLALELTDRKINSETGLEDDYLLKARILRALYNTKESNEQALWLIRKAQRLNITDNINLYSEEGLILIRMNKYPEAKLAFTRYKDALSQEQKSDYIDKELDWSREMIAKCDVLGK